MIVTEGLCLVIDWSDASVPMHRRWPEMKTRRMIFGELINAVGSVPSSEMIVVDGTSLEWSCRCQMRTGMDKFTADMALEREKCGRSVCLSFVV